MSILLRHKLIGTFLELTGILSMAAMIYFEFKYWSAGLVLIFFGYYFLRNNARCPHCGKSLTKLTGGWKRCYHCKKELDAPVENKKLKKKK